MQLITQYFEKNDREKKGYLNLDQSKKFMSELFDLDFKQSDARVTFRKFMKFVDVDGQQIVKKENALQFFANPNFM